MASAQEAFRALLPEDTAAFATWVDIIAWSRLRSGAGLAVTEAMEEPGLDDLAVGSEPGRPPQLRLGVGARRSTRWLSRLPPVPGGTARDLYREVQSLPLARLHWTVWSLGLYREV